MATFVIHGPGTFVYVKIAESPSITEQFLSQAAIKSVSLPQSILFHKDDKTARNEKELVDLLVACIRNDLDMGLYVKGSFIDFVTCNYNIMC